ncbi:MAG: sigma-70 family RNA polymerase sigma factor [Synergistetes bacterium]|nr:sigma-70 family RNA polymerase sigma factor [Synergistota bacterium]
MMWEEYLASLSKVKLLSAEEEGRLWVRFKEQGCEKAREKIIESYQPLVFKIVKGIGAGMEEELIFDLLQEGSVALISAVDEFDYHRGVKFYTFAYWKIKGAVLNYLSRKMHSYAELEDRGSMQVSDVGERIEIGSLKDVVKRSLDVLSGKERAVISSMFVDGMKPRDVALDFGISVSRVYKIKKRAMNKLKRLLSSFWNEWNSSD